MVYVTLVRNHNSFHVEITEDEQEKYRKKFGLDLELEWSQDGCCDLLSQDGTGSLGDERLCFVRCIHWNQINQGRIVVGNWGIYIVRNHKTMN